MEKKLLLDKWDVALIQYLKKEQRPTIDGLKAIWAERGSLAIEDVRTTFIVTRMIKIVTELNLASLEVVFEATNPHEQWKHLLAGPNDHVSNWLRVLASVLIGTEVSKLSGYERWE